MTAYHQTLADVPRTLVPEKNDEKKSRKEKLEKKLQIFLIISDFKILIKTPLHLKAMQ